MYVSRGRRPGDLHEVTEMFDFAYDWKVLHHVSPEQRNTMLKTYTECLLPERSTSLSASAREISSFVDLKNIGQRSVGTVLCSRLKMSEEIFLLHTLPSLI